MNVNLIFTSVELIELIMIFYLERGPSLMTTVINQFFIYAQIKFL